jgi:hypothetical protein
MPVAINLGFTVDSDEPLDHRMVVENEAGRLAIPWYHRYEGLIVWQKDTNILYVCTNPGAGSADGVSETAIASWAPIITSDTAIFPHTGSANISGSLSLIGPANLIGDTNISGSLSLIGPSTIIAPTSSATDHLFLIRTTDSVESKFVVNLEGVTVLGAFNKTPTAIAGGMFYSGSGEFYLGC